MFSTLISRRVRQMSVFVLTLLAIELLDEFVYGTGEAAWPLIRDDLGLTYAEIGLILGLPGFIANFIEPFIGILADTWKRKALIVGGGVAFGLAVMVIGSSQSFEMLLIGHILAYPASGAFVNLAQVALMDHQPERHEQNMARWTFAGSIGVLLGTLGLGVSVAVGIGWRGQYALAGITMLALTLVARRFLFPNGSSHHEQPMSFKQGVKNALAALKRRDVLRWLTLLQCSDLLLDILLGYLALYFVDVAKTSETEAGIAVAIWTGIGLVGDFLMIPLLERVNGLTYVRFSAAVQVLLYPAFLLAEPLALKLVILAGIAVFNSGWYSILQGQLYSAMPGQSGSVMAVGNVFGIVGSLIPAGIGLLAEQLGLGAAMWVLLAGPVALLVGTPKHNPEEQRDREAE